jgi:hypothetical protein
MAENATEKTKRAATQIAESAASAIIESRKQTNHYSVFTPEITNKHYSDFMSKQNKNAYKKRNPRILAKEHKLTPLYNLAKSDVIYQHR